MNKPFTLYVSSIHSLLLKQKYEIFRLHFAVLRFAQDDVLGYISSIKSLTLKVNNHQILLKK